MTATTDHTGDRPIRPRILPIGPEKYRDHHGEDDPVAEAVSGHIGPIPHHLLFSFSHGLGPLRWHCHADQGLGGSRWPGSPTRMKRISYSGYRFPPEIIQQAIWLYLRFTLSLRDVEDLLAEPGVAVSYETVRPWVKHFGPMIAADLRKRRLEPHTTWHLDEVYLKIDGRTVYLWRAGDAEGEVLDVLIQSKRNKHAALKLMRKPLKKYALAPERLVTDDLRSYRAAARELGIERRHERGRWKNNRAENSHQPTRWRECKMQRFKSPGQPRNFFPHTPPFTVPSTSNAISSQLKHTARFVLTRWTRGGPQSQWPDNS